MLCVDSGVQVTVILHKHAARGHVDRIAASTSRRLTASTQPSRRHRQLTSLTDAAPATTARHYTFTRGRRAPTSTKAAPMSPSSGKWASPAHSSSGHPAGRHANGQADSQFDSNREYVYLLSKCTPICTSRWTQGAFYVTKTKARYFFINGRSMRTDRAESTPSGFPTSRTDRRAPQAVRAGDPNSKPAWCATSTPVR